MLPSNVTANVTLPELASALISVFEGCKLTAYQDTGKIWTIGRGHTGMVDGVPIAAGMTITQQKADELFAQDQAPLFKQVAGRPLLEAAALVSFGYNCGAGALQRVMAGLSVLTQFTHNAKGGVDPGLVSRRALEENLILVSQQMAARASVSS